MSRRAAIVEEFDDDTDLPLPSFPLPNTGSRGPLLEELHISDDEFEPRGSQKAGPASPTRYQPRTESTSRGSDPTSNINRVTDITPYKNWSCIYPIYIDAKRPYGRGQRRIERAKSLWFPLSKDIADAASHLGLQTLHEVNKAHPRDWENPGRVRVQWKKDGRLVNPAVKTKKQLLEMICFYLQRVNPENIPKPPYIMSTTTPTATTPVSAKASTTPALTPSVPPSSKEKGKQPVASTLSKTKMLSSPPTVRSGGRKLPVPPEPLPDLANRVSAYSPALSTGVLIETVKAGMNATDTAGAGAGVAGAGGPGGGAVGKGKRKVVRVRG
ncbi:Signal recognition particle 19 kDa protein [Psilocybe cubensis]|uniref:Signal recognition particle 19 kDa protein n=2 Tax=Psilocybe cubensis TaxID=181762 RepID=A0ACB8GR54_PSICU|nr:Signal recognition particle 19 kDa protein [Psilocybe cubensis]KAH9477945.1 Signal recognition particle 19 kDa protein [Psilocybe cubensis]